ncbi:hypothetical protein [Streptacidiphilus sp. PAMC 29251]
MLSAGRRLPVLVVLALLVAFGAAFGLHGASARADGPVGPCENTSVCVGASTPPSGGGGSSGGSGGGGGGGGVQVCEYQGVTYPCTTDFGSFDPDDGCYYEEVQPQPAAGDPDWHGHAPGDGAVYLKTCPYTPGGGSANVWMAAAPTAPPVVTPAELAQRALAMIHRTAATVGTAPAAGDQRTALVGSPIWLWINKDPANADKTDGDYATKDDPLTATAAVPGLSVTANVYVTSVDWDMGDGGAAPRCGAGTPYQDADAGKASPDCGYSYPKPSIGQPGEQFAITATVDWTVSWVATNGVGDTFALDPIATTATALRVSELQVLN